MELSKRFGKLEFEELFEPAIDYAQNGYPVSPVISKLWRDEYERFFKNTDDRLYDEWKRVFLKDGKTYKLVSVELGSCMIPIKYINDDGITSVYHI